MREREVERRLVTAVKKRGGLAPKFTSPGLDGCPTVWYFSLLADLPSWRSRHPARKCDRFSFYGSGSWKRWAFASIALTARSRSEVS